MSRKQITVQADHTYIDRIDALARGLQDAGMVVQDTIATIGHFTGTVEADKIEQLRAIPGVAVVKVIGEEDEPPANDYSIS